MRKHFAGLCVWVLLAGCASGPSDQIESDADRAFARLGEEFTKGHLAWRPASGTYLGLHEYDGRVTDLRRESIDAELARLRKFGDAVGELAGQRLTRRHDYDLRILQSAIRGEIFRIADMDVYRKNPMSYADVIDVNIYIKRNFAPLEDRVRSIIAIEKQAPTIMTQARANLEESLAKPYVETAIQVANGAADFLRKDLVTALKDLKDETLKAEFEAANTRAISELQGYAEYLKKEKLPRAHSNYALGREKYQRMLAAELIELTPEQLLEIGLKELRREQEIFADTARKIDSTKRPIEVAKLIQRDHPTAENLISDTAKNLEAIRQFCLDKKIVTIPSPVRARVDETPQYLRATSFASMDTPGPFETKATEAYYYVTPVEPEWPPQQKEEWLSAFNYYTTDVVSIHEAYPGHYTQFLCLNASPATRLEKIFNSYAFVEGWAHYTEQMLVDEGFGANGLQTQEDLVRAAKYRLAQSIEALLRLCRMCVSIKTHCEGMSLDDATKFFERNCYYENKPAYQEALRGTYDPGYLYYTVGKLQILKLRQDWQKQEGPKFTLQRFHDELLRHGAPPIRLLREVMLKDRSQWAEVF
jgi:uncharacterized protein (DUF885 family)